LSDSERRDGERRLAEKLGSAQWGTQPRVGIYAHATGSKSYPVGWWRQVIECLRRQPAALQLLEFIPADGRPRLANEIPGLYTPDLRLLGATLAAASLVVIPDGGIMHLAEAAGARVLGLFQTTEPACYGPYRPGSEALWARDASAESVAARIRAMLHRSSAVAAG
jgi:ADP-heptose:LPS heptosyltransferase